MSDVKFIPTVRRLGYDPKQATQPKPVYYRGEGYYYRVGGLQPTGPFETHEEAEEAGYETASRLPN